MEDREAVAASDGGDAMTASLPPTLASSAADPLPAAADPLPSSQAERERRGSGGSDELDRLGRRLNRLVSGGSSPPASGPSPRKNSVGSHIPKPDFNHIHRSHSGEIPQGANMTQSLKVPGPAAAKSKGQSEQQQQEGPSKASTATSMLKSTLKKMTRLSLSPKDKASAAAAGQNVQVSSQVDGTAATAGPAARKVNSRRTSPSSSIGRAKSFRDQSGGGTHSLPYQPGSSSSVSSTSTLGSRSTVAAGMSNSLRRPKNRDLSSAATAASASRASAPRTGVSRSHSIHGRKTRASMAGGGGGERDLNVRKSRAVQTQLTRDTMRDDEDAAAASGSEDSGGAGPTPTSLDFALYMPDVLGADVDPVETLTTEHAEPADVRKNRQLTLDNMKLQREAERLRGQLAEGARERESLRKEKRVLHSRFEDVQSKLHEEQALRVKLERQMDRRDEKMREIAQSMENVEREFENRDENILALERRLRECQDVVARQQQELESGHDDAVRLRQQVDRGLDKQKELLRQLQEVEAEARELQDFLQAEKMTLAETLKDCESEISELKAGSARQQGENTALEERCSHLVRLCEQRHQENASLQAQLTGVQDKARDMLLAQGAEMSRASIHISELYSRLERLMAGGSESFSFSPLQSLSNVGKEDAVSTASSDAILIHADGGDHVLGNSVSSSQFLVPTAALAADDATTVTAGDAAGATSESLQNLSKAIAQRQRSENGGGQQQQDSLASSNGSLPSLVDRINEVEALIERLVRERRTVASSEMSSSQRSNNKLDSGEKENIIANASDEPKGKIADEVQSKENEINELKSRFLRHRQILMSNYQQAESEIRRIDEIHHESISRVLQALAPIPETVSRHPSLLALQQEFEALYNDKSATGVAAVLKQQQADVVVAANGANQSL